ncbi:MAG: PrsW family glutamic-type intramembrane protease [Chloroflexota bacterium]|nr:PrsW family glutamic-type intramembrane protease [Chloroflexota bacterium]
MRALAHAGAILLALGGAGFIALYAMVAVDRLGSDTDMREVAALAGIGVAALVAALLLELAVLCRRGALLVEFLRMPPLWLSFALFVLVGIGGGLAIWLDRVPAAEPFIAIVGVVAIAMFFWRLATRWSPQRRAPAHTMLVTMAWGMVVATTAAVVMQLAFVAAGVGGIVAGLRIAEVQIPGGLLDTLLAEDFIEASGSELAGTATVGLFVMLAYAVAAPLTEELTKFLGVVVVLRRRVLTRYTVFVAGISAGLGFAVVETIGYALGAGEGWLLVLMLRAPVTLIHVTGTSLVACGWYLQQQRGGLPLAGYFAAAVLVHAAWNGLLVSVMLASAAMPSTGDPDPALVIAVLGALGLMAVLLASCLAWVIANARRWGREFSDPPVSLAPATVFSAPRPALYSVERVPSVSGPLSREV